MVPRIATPCPAGYDLVSIVYDEVKPGTTMAISTGIGVHFAPGHVGIVCQRSSVGLQSIAVAGGIIDQDYIGEIKVLLTNNSRKVWRVEPGMKIAQLLVVPCKMIPAIIVDYLPETQRGDKGFGSTGARAEGESGSHSSAAAPEPPPASKGKANFWDSAEFIMPFTEADESSDEGETTMWREHSDSEPESSDFNVGGIPVGVPTLPKFRTRIMWTGMSCAEMRNTGNR